MSVLEKDIVAFDRMRVDLEQCHPNEWVVFHQGVFEGAYSEFEDAAAAAVERFDQGPYLIRQVGAPPVQLPGGMIFTPAHFLGSSRI